MTARPYDFAVLGRGRLGNGVLQLMFDGEEAVFVPPFPVSDRAADAAGLLALTPGNPGSNLAPWPWIMRTGLLIHGPAWVGRIAETLAEATTGDLLIQIVRRPDDHMVALYRHVVRHRATLAYGGAGVDANWAAGLAQLHDLDRFLAEFGDTCRYHAIGAPAAAGFRRWLAIDFTELMPERIDGAIDGIFGALGGAYSGDRAPLRQIERTIAKHYLSASITVVDLFGARVPVKLGHPGDIDPNHEERFEQELCRLEPEEVAPFQPSTFALEPRPLALLTSRGAYSVMPWRLRRRIAADDGWRRLMTERILPAWSGNADRVERRVAAHMAQVDLDRLRRAILPLIAEDLSQFRVVHPKVGVDWTA
jgi:hypothetical protein